jgi:hypothetical protein
MGIEPTSAAWEAAILPLNHARSGLPYQTDRDFGKSSLERVVGQTDPLPRSEFLSYDPARASWEPAPARGESGFIEPFE